MDSMDWAKAVLQMQSVVKEIKEKAKQQQQAAAADKTGGLSDADKAVPADHLQPIHTLKELGKFAGSRLRPDRIPLDEPLEVLIFNHIRIVLFQERYALGLEP